MKCEITSEQLQRVKEGFEQAKRGEGMTFEEWKAYSDNL